MLSRLPAILARYERELLRGWLRHQPSVEGESEAQAALDSAALLRAVIEAAARAETWDLAGSAWAEVRHVLAEIAAARAERGSRPDQTVAFVLALREPLVSRLRAELGQDPATFAEAVSRVTAWLAELSLHAAAVASQRMAAKLSESEALRRELFEAHPHPMWVYDLDTLGFLAVNDAAIRQYGYRRQDFAAMTIADIRPPEDVPRLRANVARVGDGLDRAGLWRHRRKDGSVIEVEITSHTIRFDGRRAELVLAQDVTARRLSEERLRQAQNLEAVARLAGGIAHDFNNMLGVVIGYAEMARARTPPDDPNAESLQQILEVAQRSSGLVGQLLAFARQQTVEPKLIDLNAFLRESGKMLSRLVGEEINVKFAAGRNLWLVKIDPGQIDQVLANLMVNARDAIAGTGEVRIETHNAVLDEAYCAEHQGVRPGEYVLLVFSDSGSGMDSETQQRLFEPFFTTKEHGKGTGLGLSTVYGIVQQNHGFINVYSEAGHGTTFRIYLPRYQGTPAERREAVADLTPTGTETVLVVEDNPQLLRLCQEMLRRLGYKVLSAALPSEALELCESHPGEIHLVMTDVVMPGMNGRELLERVERLRPGIKALFMSGYTADVIADRGVLPEGVQFVQKPFSRSTLAIKVREVLDG